MIALPGHCPLATPGRLPQGPLPLSPLNGEAVPELSSQLHLPPESGQATLMRNLLLVQAFNRVEVLSPSVFGEWTTCLLKKLQDV